ncbi:replication factor C subunit 5, putative [Theileria equi strain WA]|uniref:Replication factor C subunit 5, putative n=1 Tax=Theileria equi strain WA TaxID=1537102 RepID=L1LGI7_THEEQ|nr:replication factor C subunit 5, putative [Theileria equi strain WA]EKX74365.1 replication factor C subunit 5, putative [Theileria equi strain WA]|eukprot:XP_004833817.1 replication factor C subunit 5, putative [Theileria equi strain WA]
MLWIDKHCPKHLHELTSHKDVNELLIKLVNKSHGELPHFLFYGPSGAGKKTRILATLRSVFGAKVDKVKTDVLSYKDSNEIIVCQSESHIQIPCPELGTRDRVIIQDVIRNLSSAPSASNYFTKGPSYRVFLFEDADSLSHEAQAALRRTMETYIKNARMFLHVRQLSRIMPPLRSRCLCIRIRSHTPQEILDILREICNAENITPGQASDSMLLNIAESSNRNLRRSILMLEAVAMGGFTLETKNFMMPWERNIKQIVDSALSSQTPSTLSSLRPQIYELLVCCIPGEIILETIVNQLIKRVKPVLVPNIIHLAAHFSHTMKLGSKDIWHIEAFIAQTMSLVARRQPKKA